VLLATLALLISLSAPLAIVLAPIILLRVVRDRRIELFDTGLLAGTIIEWTIIALHWSAKPGTIQFLTAMRTESARPAKV
jgi:hypothetical protein